MNNIFKVVAQQKPFQITKADGTQLNKCQIVLQEIGGKYANSYVCNLLGNLALCKFTASNIVIATLSFKHTEYQGKIYQDINVEDIIPFGNI